MVPRYQQGGTEYRIQPPSPHKALGRRLVRDYTGYLSLLRKLQARDPWLHRELLRLAQHTGARVAFRSHAYDDSLERVARLLSAGSLELRELTVQRIAPLNVPRTEEEDAPRDEPEPVEEPWTDILEITLQSPDGEGLVPYAEFVVRFPDGRLFDGRCNAAGIGSVDITGFSPSDIKVHFPMHVLRAAPNSVPAGSSSRHFCLGGEH